MRYILCFLLLTSPLLGIKSPLPDHMSIFLGPGIYHLLRVRQGGTMQKGLLAGLTGTIERHKPGGLYAAVEGNFGAGGVRGHNSVDLDLYSKILEAQIEGRFGYTINPSFCKTIMVTPYLGYGFFEATNELKPPSPLLVTIKDKYEYLAAGLLTRIVLSSEFSIGFECKSRISFVGRSKIYNDPIYKTQVITMGEVMQYELDIPVCYRGCLWGIQVVNLVEPFYAFRNYAGLSNYPFDFLHTRFHLWGIRWMTGFEF